MKTVGIEGATLGTCVDDSQRERVVVTRNGVPVAVVIGLEGLDAEQIATGSSAEFWKLIGERRGQKSISRQELEQRLVSDSGSK